ncbi:hypothetical protein ABK040_008844 [Willaertia magna]
MLSNDQEAKSSTDLLDQLDESQAKKLLLKLCEKDENILKRALEEKETVDIQEDEDKIPSKAVTIYQKIKKALSGVEYRKSWKTMSYPFVSQNIKALYDNYASFYCGGYIYCDRDRIHLFVDNEDMGDILKLDIEKLKAKAKPSPFGKGQETVFDENIRKASEITSDRMKFKLKGSYVRASSSGDNPRTPIEDHIVSETCVMSRGGQPFTMKLYKLCIYEEGGHFKEHIDTLHGPDHVGTAVVCLPSKHEGGDLVVWKGKTEKRFSFADKSESGVTWAAFYTDCKHLVEPITSGTRIVLQYDLFGNEDESPELIVKEKINKKEDKKEEQEDKKEVKKKARKGEDEEDENEEDEEDDLEREIEDEERKESSKEYWRERSYNMDKNIEKVTEIPSSYKDQVLEAIAKGIDSFIEEHTNKNLAILLFHRYHSMATKPYLLKGVDADLYNYLEKVGKWKLSLTPIVVFYSYDPYYDSSKFELRAAPFGSKDIEAILTKKKRKIFEEDDDEAVAKDTRDTILLEDENKQAVTLLSYQEANEHTGNESQPEHAVYYGGTLVIERK